MSKTKKILTGISSVALLAGMTGCSSSSSVPSQPTDTQCSSWEWDYDDGVWECEDSSSRYLNHYYHGGIYYPNKTSLHKSSSFKSYKGSSNFKGSTSKGFGSGSKSSSFGG